MSPLKSYLAGLVIDSGSNDNWIITKVCYKDEPSFYFLYFIIFAFYDCCISSESVHIYPQMFWGIFTIMIPTPLVAINVGNELPQPQPNHNTTSVQTQLRAKKSRFGEKEANTNTNLDF